MNQQDGEGAKRNLLHDGPQDNNEQEQQKALIHIGPFRLGTVVHVDGASNDDRNDRQSTKTAGDHGAQSNTRQVFVEVGLSFVRIDFVNRLCDGQRLDRTDQQNGYHGNPEFRRINHLEIRMHDRRHHIVRNIQQELRPNMKFLSEQGDVVFFEEVECVSKWDRECNDPHRSRQKMKQLVTDFGMQNHQRQTSQRDNHHKGVCFWQ